MEEDEPPQCQHGSAAAAVTQLWLLRGRQAVTLLRIHPRHFYLSPASQVSVGCAVLNSDLAGEDTVFFPFPLESELFAFFRFPPLSFTKWAH